jgi:hypothetical protein
MRSPALAVDSVMEYATGTVAPPAVPVLRREFRLTRIGSLVMHAFASRQSRATDLRWDSEQSVNNLFPNTR